MARMVTELYARQHEVVAHAPEPNRIGQPTAAEAAGSSSVMGKVSLLSVLSIN